MEKSVIELRGGSRSRPALLVLLAVLVTSCATASNSSSDSTASSAATSAGRMVPRLASLVADNDSVAIAAALRSQCGKADKAACYEANLIPIADSGHVKLAMGTLNQLGRVDSDVRRDGHVYAHGIGIAAGKKTRDVVATFNECTETFQSGCYHGAIQSWFAALDTIGSKEANDLCAPFRADASQRWIRFQCVHGMGHGLTTLNDHDLKKGLAGCDLLTDWWERRSCYGGAFMENIVNVTNPHHPAAQLAHHAGANEDHAGHDMAGMEGMNHHPAAFKAVDPADQQYPCSILDDRYLAACYEMQTSVMLHNNKGDIAAAARSCDNAPKTMRTICYSSLGRDISAYSEQDHATGVRMCSWGAATYQPWCYLGLVKNIVDLNARPDEGIAFCRKVPGEGNKNSCYAAVGDQIAFLGANNSARREMCSISEAAYLDACLYGAGLKTEAPPALQAVRRSVDQ